MATKTISYGIIFVHDCISFDQRSPSRCYHTTTQMAFVNKSNPNADQFFPLHEPAIGAAYPVVCFYSIIQKPSSVRSQVFSLVRFPPE